MARQGASRPKVVSSGRLTAGGRAHINKKKVAGKSLPALEPAYSLYSTDSEDQVTTVHKGLDRCAALLNGILEAEQEESNSNARGVKSSISKSKPRNLSKKTEMGRKQQVRKTNAGMQAHRKPVQKILSAGSYPGLNPVNRDKPSGPALVRKTKHIRQHSVPALTHPAVNSEVQTQTTFNHRLTTSTPALSPQRSASAHSEPCSSKCSQNRMISPEECHLVTATQFPGSFSVPATVEQQCPIALQSHFQNTICPHVKQGLPLINSPVCSASMGSRDLNENMSCASASASAAQVPVQTNMHLARPDPNGALMQCSQESSEVSEGHTSEEEENDVGDTKPVREISCQINKEKDLSNTTSCPEKTARRVMTVRYLLGELKALVASQDSEAVRLVSEVEQSISLLPLMVGSTNIQAEIALALQPLRSENVQLRRRLRILNQQLLERERAERRARPVDCNMEVVALQSLNFTLQTQLNESHREYQNLQQENMRLQNTLEKKENDWQQHKEQLQTENSRLRLELSEALAEMKSCQMKLQEDELEKNVLTQSLQQGESEVHRLQEFIRSLQRSQIKPNVSQSSQQLDLHQPNYQLTKSVLELHETAQRETTASDKISSTVKTYLQTLEGTGQASPPQRARIIRSESEFCPPENQEIHNPSLEVISENVSAKAEQKATSFAPLRETSVGQHVSGVPPGKSLTHGDELTVNKQKVENIGLRYMARAFEKLGVSDELNQILDQSQQCVKMDVRERYSAGRPSAMETTFASLASDMSVKSWTTFNTRDEQNFRDGLAALDASIESLQKTLRSNLNK